MIMNMMRSYMRSVYVSPHCLRDKIKGQLFPQVLNKVRAINSTGKYQVYTTNPMTITRIIASYFS